MKHVFLSSMLAAWAAGSAPAALAQTYATSGECRAAVGAEYDRARREKDDCIKRAGQTADSFGEALLNATGSCLVLTQRADRLFSEKQKCSKLPIAVNKPTGFGATADTESGFADTYRSTSSGGAGSCPADLEHIADKLPVYADPQLRDLREMGLRTDIKLALATARAQGLSPAAAASSTLQQAELYERETVPSAEQCIRAAAANPGAVLQAMRMGVYRFGSHSISETCARAYIGAHYAAVVNRAAAVAMTCWARQGG